MKVSNTYYSNCLVEALRAKFSDWKNVRIITFLPSYAGSLHFAWTDGKNDYWFMNDSPTEGLFDTLWHEGAIEKRRVGTFDKLKQIQKRENL